MSLSPQPVTPSPQSAPDSSPTSASGNGAELHDQVYITTWDDPLVDRLGHDPRSAYVEQFWLGVLGPSAIWLLRHCRNELDRSPTGFVLDLTETAGARSEEHTSELQSH